MKNRYRFGIHEGLNCEELFCLIVIDETCKQLGIEDLADVGAVLLGQRTLPTRGKFEGAVPGTSIASVVSRRLLPFELKHRILPTVTSFGSLLMLRIKFTRNLGAFVGRAIPGVGWVILATDVSTIIYRSVITYNNLVAEEDRQ